MMKLRVVTVDHYQSKPVNGLDDLYSELRGSDVPNRVPVIRIFGVTETGVKVCLHVHGVFPYISVPFEGEQYVDNISYIKTLSQDLEVNLGPKPVFKKTFRTQPQPQVHKIDVMRAKQFYGYHASDEAFLRIHFYNPFIVKKAIDYFWKERQMQPHEAHISFILQFFIDYNLHGMNYITVSRVIHRTTAGPSTGFEDTARCSSEGGIRLAKATRCQVECDCKASDILNPTDKSANSGLDLIWAEERDRLRRVGRSSQITPQQSQESRNYQIMESEQKHLELIQQFADGFEVSGDFLTAANCPTSQSSSQESDVTLEHLDSDTEYGEDDYVNLVLRMAGNQRRHCTENEEENENDSDQEDENEVAAEMSQTLNDLGVDTSFCDDLEPQIDPSVELSKPTSDVSKSSQGTEHYSFSSIAALRDPTTEDENGAERVFAIGKNENILLDDNDWSWAVESDEELENMVCKCDPGQSCHLCTDARVEATQSQSQRSRDLFSSEAGSQEQKDNTGDLDVAEIDKDEPEVGDEEVNEDEDSSTGIYSFYEFGNSSSKISASPPVASQETSLKLSSPSLSSLPTHSTPRQVKGLKKRKSFISDDISFIQMSPKLLPINEEANDSADNMIPTTSRHSTLCDIRPLSQTSNGPEKRRRLSCDSLIEGRTASQTFDFAISSVEDEIKNLGKISCSAHEFQFISLMSLELHINTRGDLRPDPKHDAIRALFYTTFRDSDRQEMSSGVIVIETNVNEMMVENDSHILQMQRKLLARTGFSRRKLEVSYVEDEIFLLLKFSEVMEEHDPELIVGFEIETLSWGYLLERAEVLNIRFTTTLSRLLDENSPGCASDCNIDYGPEIRLPGRIVLNLWRVLRHEITLNVYSYENAHFHVLHERIPAYSFRNLTDWFEEIPKGNVWRVVEHYLLRTEGCLRIINKIGLISRTSELARVFGIQFYEVLSRGSQFRVESMMLRYTKRLNFVTVSPTVSQRGQMFAPEYIPLVMEPESKFYTDPVVVLDFQSLYPSLIIAYNYCYSTCLGRVNCLIKDEPFPFGCSTLNVPKSVLKDIKNKLHVSRNGSTFVKQEVIRGVLPQMLEQILETRVMVKNAMKENNKSQNPSKSLNRILDARQLALKLIANVTYGYTSANFSGRMPCVEIADAIVSKGRETLERAIELVNNETKWGGRVIYGDTDSIFILFAGCTKEEAFKRGREIADVVTSLNPRPMKLKFEKVYMPCVLQTKKRYVGFKYEDVDQKEPVFDAKGTENVRRDTCRVNSKVLEKALRILFTSQNVNDVKTYVQRQFQKIFMGKVSSLQNFVFAREYRGRDKYSARACVPSLAITKKLMSADPRAEPRRGERVPYVFIYGSPNQPLIQLVKQPIDLIRNPSLRLNAVYYVERVMIPTLNRVFNLMGINAMTWYNEMPRKGTYQRWRYIHGMGGEEREKGRQFTISQYFASGNCSICEQKTPSGGICGDCTRDSQGSALFLSEEIRRIEGKFGAIVRICMSCTGSNDIESQCRSIDCPNLFRLSQTKLDVLNLDYIRELISQLKVSQDL